MPWRTPLSDDKILLRLLSTHVWPHDATTPSSDEVAALTIRLAANCCLGSPRIHELLAGHLDDLREVLTRRALCEITIGLLANLLYNHCAVLEVSTLVGKGFHATIAAQLETGNLNTDHPLFDTALELLEAISEEDLELRVPNEESTLAAVKSISLFITSDHTPEGEVLEALVRILLRWASKKSLRLASTNLAQVYQAFLWSSAEEEDNKAEAEQGQSLLVPFESILGESASDCADDAGATPDLLEAVIPWIRYETRITPAFKADRLCATGFLILCNLCTESFAIAAVQDLNLHEPTISVLRSRERRQVKELRKNAAAFLANMCQPRLNRTMILRTNIVSDLFYDVPDVETELPIHMMRRLVGGGYADAVEAAMADSRNGVPSFKHILEQLSDQKQLQDDIAKAKPEGEGFGHQATVIPGEQLTKDIAHIYVDVRRHAVQVNEMVTPKLIWALVNLVIISLRSRNPFDASEGVLGLGLALQGEKVLVAAYAVDAIEALTRTSGLAAFKQVIESGKSNGSNTVATKVSENATNVLSRLLEVAKEKILPTDVQVKLLDVLTIGTAVEVD